MLVAGFSVLALHLNQYRSQDNYLFIAYNSSQLVLGDRQFIFASLMALRVITHNSLAQQDFDIFFFFLYISTEFSLRKPPGKPPGKPNAYITVNI